MRIHPFQAIYPNTDLIASPDSFFATVRNDYVEYYKNGFFCNASENAFYFLEIRKGDQVHSGIVVALEIEDYTKGNIIKHEQTIAASEQEMLKVLLQRGAMIKPVLLCHPSRNEIEDEIQRLRDVNKRSLLLSTVIEDQEYNLYQVDEKEGKELARLYNDLIPKVYIADGHHRFSTGEKLMNLERNKKKKNYSLMLAALFSFDQLSILDYNRIVHLPYHLKLTRFIARLSHVVHIELLDGPQKPTRKHDLSMVIQDEWYKLTWKTEILKKYNHSPAILDAHVLDKEILERILDITDIRTDERVEYLPGKISAHDVEEKTLASDHHVGFLIYPVQFDELVSVSDSGGTLPPKSTWFEPRMINGLVVKSFE